MPNYFTHHRHKDGKDEWGYWQHSRMQGRLPDYAASSVLCGAGRCDRSVLRCPWRMPQDAQG